MVQAWEGTTPEDAYYWYPVYAARFFVRTGLVEGSAIIAAVGFLVTGEWILLAAAGVMLVVFVGQVPSRAAVEALAMDSQMRQQSVE